MEESGHNLSGGNPSVSRDELMEALRQSEVDNEFVWSLWKQAQQELPDVSSIIDMVVTKERCKYEQQERNLVEKLKEKDDMIASSQENNVTLNGKLAACEKELIETRTLCSYNSEQTKITKNELIRSRETWTHRSAVQAADIKILLDKNKELKREIFSLREKRKSLKIEPTPEKKGVYTAHQRTKDYKRELDLKSEELLHLRSLHDRRLERMKALKASYDLTVEQLKTYECKESQSHASPVHEGVLQHEDTKSVWNELSQYKTNVTDLRKRLLQAEEERDTLKAQCLQFKSMLFEHTAIDQQMKEDIRGKLSAIAAIESLAHEKNEKVSGLKSAIKELKIENKIITQKTMDLESECKKLHADIDGKNILLADLEKHKEDASTMTSNQMIAISSSPPRKIQTRDSSMMTEKQDVVDIEIQVGGQHTITVRENDEAKNENNALEKMRIDRCSMSKHGHHRSYTEGDVLRYDVATQAHEFDDLKITTTPCQSGMLFSKGHKESAKNPSTRSRDKSTSNAQSMTPSGTDDISKVRVSTGTQNHKCMWQQQVRNLQQRLKSLGKQITLVNTAKQLLTVHLDEESSLRLKAESELRDTAKKYQGSKTMAESLRNEKLKALKEMKELQSSLSKMEARSEHRSETDWRKMEAQYKELQSKCTFLNSTIRSREATIKVKSVELSSALERCSKLERDVKQKRSLVEDQKRKQTECRETVSKIEEQNNILMDNIQSLTETLGQDKQKIKSLRLQLSASENKRHQLEENLVLSKNEIVKNQAHHDNEIKLKQLLKQVKEDHGLSTKVQQQNHQEFVKRVEAEHEYQNATLREFKALIMQMAELLIQSFTEEQLKRNEAVFVHDPDTNALAGRVREIARTALNFSDMELEDFFSDEQETDHLLLGVEQERHDSFRNLVAQKMSSKLKVPFADELIKVFSEYMSANICDEEN